MSSMTYAESLVRTEMDTTLTHTPEVENHDERIRAKKKVSPKNVELHKLELHMFIIREKMPRHIFRLFRAKYARSDIVQAE
jgi:hypothetical protein